MPFWGVIQIFHVSVKGNLCCVRKMQCFRPAQNINFLKAAFNKLCVQNGHTVFLCHHTVHSVLTLQLQG